MLIEVAVAVVALVLGVALGRAGRRYEKREADIAWHDRDIALAEAQRAVRKLEQVRHVAWVPERYPGRFVPARDAQARRLAAGLAELRRRP